jgi:hypothetical protein
VKLEGEMKKKYGTEAPASVLGGKVVPPSLPEKKKRGKGAGKPRRWEGKGK